MTLQYLDALKEIGASAATKYVIPLELTDLARRIGNFLDNGMESGASVRLGESVDPSKSKAEDQSAT